MLTPGGRGDGEGKGKEEEKRGHAGEKHKLTLPTVSNYTIHDTEDMENAKQDGVYPTCHYLFIYASHLFILSMIVDRVQFDSIFENRDRGSSLAMSCSELHSLSDISNLGY